jgi:alpha-ketoglutaric semialdehyde dehydrogenase
MELHGKNIIAGKAVEVGGKTFQAFAPASGKSIEPHFEGATADQVNQALETAESAFHEYRRLSPERRANFLEKIADEILALGDALIERAHDKSVADVRRSDPRRLVGRRAH